MVIVYLLTIFAKTSVVVFELGTAERPVRFLQTSEAALSTTDTFYRERFIFVSQLISTMKNAPTATEFISTDISNNVGILNERCTCPANHDMTPTVSHR